jgi:hypothetical protein
MAIKMAFIPTLTFCSLPWFPYVSKSHLKPICKIYRRLVLWATGAASTTKHENLLGESAMLSFHDTLTIHSESTWTKWECFHDHKINRADTPKCQCGFNNETIAQFLLYCPMYRAQRRVLHNNITKIAGRSASPLNLDVLLDQPKCTPSTLAFVDAVKLARTAI